jgi:hypothetical protein
VALRVAAVLLSRERPPPTTQEQRPQSAQEEQPSDDGREEAALRYGAVGVPLDGRTLSLARGSGDAHLVGA